MGRRQAISYGLPATLSVLTFVCAIACKSISSDSSQKTHSIIKVDQRAFYLALNEKRPELITSDCKNNLIVKPKYRNRILNGESYSQIYRAEYSDKTQAEDLAWANLHRAMFQKIESEGGLKSTQIKIAKYPPEAFVGYKLGPDLSFGSNRVMPKVFFEFLSATNDLSPSLFLDFMRTLEKAGYHGDVKLSLFPGRVRFQFNNLIAHAASFEDANTVEKTGLAFFEDKLASMGRGVDVSEDGSEKNAYDWNQYLCLAKPLHFSPEVLQFLTGR